MSQPCRLAFAIIALGFPLLLALGCEQILGLDGPYNTSIISNSTSCTGSVEETCYSADPSTIGVGVCKAGQRVCENGVWSPCYGEVTPTYETCTGEDVDCNGAVTCASEFAWGKAFGGPADDAIRAVAVDAKNNVFVTGRFNETIDFGGGPLMSAGGDDIFFAKFDPSGKHLWSLSFGGPGNDHGNAIAVDSAGNVQLFGDFEQTVDFGDGPRTVPTSQRAIFLAKFGPNAEFLGSTAFFATNFDSGHITFDPNDDLILTTRFFGQIDFGGGIYSSQNDAPIAIAKFNGKTGAHIWTRVYNGANIERVFVDSDSSGNIAIAGYFSGKLNLGGGVLESSKYDGYLVKLSPDGQHLWSTKFGGMDDESVDDFTLDQTNQWVLVGAWNPQTPDSTTTIGSETFKTHGGVDMFLTKYGNDGAFVWAKDLGSLGNEGGGSVATDSAGNIVISGTSDKGTTDLGFGPLGTAGLFVLKFDASGMPLWMRNSSAATLNGFYSRVATDSYRAIVIGGRFETPLGFAGFSFPSAGSGDGYLMKIAP